MTDRVHYHPNLIFSVGTQVVTLVDIPGSAGLVLHPRGTVGVVVKSPTDQEHSYRVRFPDGFEAALKRSEVTMLARFKEGEIGDSAHAVAHTDLYERVIYRCVIGSQAYGLADAASDVDRRGIYLPTADLHWSLYGVPEQLENDETQEAYWELQKFLVLALKANPNVLECLYTPLVEKATPLAEELLAHEVDLPVAAGLPDVQRLRDVAVQEDAGRPPQPGPGQVEARHAPDPAAAVGHRRAARRRCAGAGGEPPRPAAGDPARRGAVGRGRGLAARLHQEFNAASETTKLPERPDYERANAFLIRPGVGPCRRTCHDPDAAA